ncbi:hypothetical protein ACHQM5_021170 [Ranunculus cassubicifolius]
MASPQKGIFGTDASFTPVDVSAEMNPSANNGFPVDAVSSEIYTSKQLKEENEAEEKKKGESGKKVKGNDGGDKKIGATLVLSGVVVAVIGAIFAFVKNVKQQQNTSSSKS